MPECVQIVPAPGRRAIKIARRSITLRQIDVIAPKPFEINISRIKVDFSNADISYPAFLTRCLDTIERGVDVVHRKVERLGASIDDIELVHIEVVGIFGRVHFLDAFVGAVQDFSVSLRIVLRLEEDERQKVLAVSLK